MERLPPPRHLAVDVTRRRLLGGLPVALSMLVLGLGLGACGKDAAPKPGPVVSTDLDALRRLMQLPADVAHAEWQTGAMAEHGGDWWLAAVLDIPTGRMVSLLADPARPGTLDTPPGMLATASFAALKALPGAKPVADGRWQVPGDLHGVAPFARSPLLQGNALPLSATQVFVLLWTS